MNRVRPLAIGLVCVFWGCSEPEASGTNTNWLRACQDSTECGSFGCACGHCTSSCESDADCAAVGGICSSTESTLAECRGTVTERLCLPPCDASGRCEAGQICYRGACTHTLAPMSCADHPGALVCEDFEGPLDAYRPIVTSGNRVQAVEIATPSGARALESQVLVAPSTAYLRADFDPLSTGSLSMRSWIQVPASQTSYDLAPMGFWSDEETAWALRVVAKDDRLEAWSYTAPLAGSAVLTLGEWHCLQVTLEIAESGRVRIALDGDPVVDVANFDTLPVGGIGAVAVGSLWAGAAATILVDRVLVGPTPSSCWD